MKVEPSKKIHQDYKWSIDIGDIYTMYGTSWIKVLMNRGADVTKYWIHILLS